MLLSKLVRHKIQTYKSRKSLKFIIRIRTPAYGRHNPLTELAIQVIENKFSCSYTGAITQPNLMKIFVPRRILQPSTAIVNESYGLSPV